MNKSPFWIKTVLYVFKVLLPEVFELLGLLAFNSFSLLLLLVGLFELDEFFKPLFKAL